MTKQEIEEEISFHYNKTSKAKRKEFDEDIIYKLCIKDGDYVAALKRAFEIFDGSAKNMAELRRQIKKKRKVEKVEKDIVEALARMSESERADLFAKVKNEKLKNQ